MPQIDKMRLFCIFLLLLSTCNATLHQFSFVFGGYTSVVIYDPVYAEDEDYRFMLTRVSGSTLYLVGMVNGVTSDVICTETVTTPIIVAPKGCDAQSERDAVLRTNCGHKTIEGLVNYWFMAKTDPRCVQGGSEVTCLGDAWVGDEIYDKHVHTGWDVIEYGMYVKSGMGLSCSMPVMTRVDVKLNSLTIVSSCNQYVKSGVYIVDKQASMPFTFWYLTWTVIISDPRLDVFRVEFKHLDQETYVDENGMFFTQLLVQNTSCIYQIDVNYEKPTEIEMYKSRVSFNYYQTMVNAAFNMAKVCDIKVGRLSFDNKQSIYRQVAEGVPAGGLPRFKTKIGVPIEIKPDVRFRDFDDDCARFYPPSETFRGFGFSGFDGPLYSRHVPASLTCYAPFPFPEMLVEGTLISRAKQCHMLGGWLATTTNDVCAMDSWKTYCRLGWLYFDQRCWYKFDGTSESIYKVPVGAETERVCKLMNPHATTALSITHVVSAWLQRFFVFWKDENVKTRIVISGRNCHCYSATNGVESCSCQTPEFPMCVYHVKDDPLFWQEMDIHPATLSVLKNGQDGIAYDGSELGCECLPGSTGKYCNLQTCVANVVIQTTPSELIQQNKYLSFFQKCYSHKHGTCFNNNPNKCVCTYGYGPAADLILDMYVEFPCMFPSWIGMVVNEPVKVWRQNGTISEFYVTGKGALLCGGSRRGIAKFSGWNDGVCLCINGFDGRACSCQLPHYIEGFDVTRITCNGHGTCCPNVVSGLCVGLKAQNGCNCEDGFVGEACTARIPFSLKSSLETTTESYTFITLSTRKMVVKVYTESWIQPYRVTTVSIDSDEIDCVQASFVEEWEVAFGVRWNCSGIARAHYVRAYSFNSTEEKITIKAFDEDFKPGGYHVNPYSAQYYPTDEFHFKYAQFGVTNGPTFCAPGFIGPVCNIGVSSYHYDESGYGGVTPRLCGDSTQPKRGKISESGTSCECSIIGTSIAFHNSSCECASVDGQMCGGIGMCMPVRFQYGVCDMDIQAFANDPLSTPYSSVKNGFTELGAVSCSNPIHRLFDAGVICAESNVLGYGYGIFHNMTPGVDFTLEPWTERHYRMIATFMGNKTCGAQLMIKENMDLYFKTYASAHLLPEMMSNVMPIDQYVRQIILTALENVYGVVVYDVNWNVCGEHDDMIFENETVTIDVHMCEDQFGTIVERMTNQTLDTRISVEYRYMSEPYGKMMRDFQHSLFTTYVFPQSSVFMCNGTTIDLVRDRELLRRVWSSTLAMRKCSHDKQCGSTSKCVVSKFDTLDVHIPWLNGDNTMNGFGLGIEGGCECQGRISTGFYDYATYCSTCALGYGPDTESDYRGMEAFQKRLGGEWLNGDVRAIARCSLPVDPGSTRVTSVCGGKGYVRYGRNVTNVFQTYVFRGNLIRGCDAMVLDKTRVFVLLPHDKVSVFIQTFQEGGEYLNMIYSSFYLNGEEVEKTRLMCMSLQNKTRNERQVYYRDGKIVLTRAFLGENVLKMI